MNRESISSSRMTNANIRLIPAKFLVACVLFVCFASFPASGKWKPENARPPVRAEHGMVVCAHPLAGRAGRAILEKGGNAVDAAVATAFALSVVEPYSSGLGGGGFMLIYPGPGTEVAVLDYRERAPRKATRDMYVRDGKVVAGLSTAGPLAVGVPGVVAGLAEALARYGTMPLSEVMAPAIALAADGFTVDKMFHERELISLKLLRADPCAREVFLRGGRPLLPGQRLSQPDLARTLRLIAEQGPDVFYSGELAQALVKDVEKKGGIIGAEDLAAFRVRWLTPVTGSYRGYEIVSMPPPSSGGAAVIETLNILEGYDLKALGFDSPQTAHLLIEAMKRSFADRAAFMGDPAFVQAPLDTLLSKQYAEALREEIDPDKATPGKDVVPGGGIIAPPPDFEKSAGREGRDTTHLSVVDASGGAVSLTQTVNTVFGSGVVACGTGVLLNNEMDDFAAMPGAPNAFGLIQGEANAIAPGKTPLSSMSPTMVFKDGRLFLVIGSPGGPRIITTVIQAIVNVIDFGMDVAAAVSAPRLHQQWLPDRVYAERGRLSARARALLSRRGHTIKNYIIACNAQAVMVAPDGSLLGASDPRAIGVPLGY